jgi:hypothetical protein
MVEAFESILLVVFLNTPAPGALKLWAKAFDEDPTGFNSGMAGSSSVQGSVGGYSVTLSVQTTRVDINVAGAVTQPPRAPPTPVGDLSVAVDFAFTRMKTLIPELNVGRAAMVIQGHTLTANDTETISTLRNMLPSAAVPNDAVDLSYQVTVPRNSELKPGRVINQLCRWQSVQLQVLQFQIGDPNQTKAIESKPAALVYVDVFARDMEGLDDQSAMEAVEEVGGRAMELITRGFDELS